MKEITILIIKIIHIISLCGLVLMGILGAIYEIIGHAKYEQLLSTIGVHSGFHRTWIVFIILIIVCIITYFAKENIT